MTQLTTAPTPTPPPVRRPLLTPIPDSPGDFLLVIDNSSLEKFTTCPKSAEFYLVDEREAQLRNSALVFGGALHAGLEKLLTGHSDEVQNLAIANHFAIHPSPADYRTVEIALEVMHHYRTHSQFPGYEMEVLSDEKGLLVERPFELPLGVIPVDDIIQMPWALPAGEGLFVKSIHVAWSGRIDCICNTHSLNRVLDHKTTSIMGDTFSQDFQLSNQVLGYIWAAQQLWPQHNVTGFCVNAIYLKKPPVSGYGSSLMSAGPRGGKPSLEFHRFYYDYSPDRIQWWAQNCLTIIGDFIHSLVRNFFTSHTKNCMGKYGRCQYHDICSLDDPSMQRSILSSDIYRPVTWNPVA